MHGKSRRCSLFPCRTVRSRDSASSSRRLSSRNWRRDFLRSKPTAASALTIRRQRFAAGHSPGIPCASAVAERRGANRTGRRRSPNPLEFLSTGPPASAGRWECVASEASGETASAAEASPPEAIKGDIPPAAAPPPTGAAPHLPIGGPAREIHHLPRRHGGERDGGDCLDAIGSTASLKTIWPFVSCWWRTTISWFTSMRRQTLFRRWIPVR